MTKGLNPLGPDNHGNVRAFPWIFAIAISTLFFIWLNPMGYMGGRWDDWQYLNAARCWVDNGACIPNDHWQGRWPIIAPLALAMEMLGESRWSIAIPTLLAGIGTIALIAWIGNRLFSPPVGYIAALLWTAMPTFMLQILQPNISHVELFLLLSSVAAIMRYLAGKDWRWALASGILLGLAFQARETAILAVPLFAIAAWKFARQDWKALLAAALGALSPLIAELIIYWLWTGDPFFRRTLSVEHARVFTPELLGDIDPDQPPFFNPQYIANWNHRPGFDVHWLINGPLNLFANAQAGVFLFLTALLLPFSWRSLQQGTRKTIVWTLAAAAFWIAGLTYAFAIDPKPRMMMVPISMFALIVAALLVHLWRTDRKLLVVVSSAMAAIASMIVVSGHQRIRTTEPVVAEWLVEYDGQIETDVNTRRHLTLAEGINQVASAGSGKPFLLIKSDMTCDKFAEAYFPDRLRGPIARTELSPYGHLVEGSAGSVCIFNLQGSISEAEIEAAKLDAHAPATPYRIVRVINRFLS